ncbi:MAG: endonuclease/exonuclease/phosphatase family protein [Sphaerochaetaceae bacterium]|jgi:endonuclease/exonuclease/phosphatase family metal-dependent hydrolase|nr:endonuclease/exonuclease/phosphatase family protein [Sphaerochaetaceae bacterium]
MQRISLISLNLWNTERLDERKDCLVSFVQCYQADLFCFQEIRPVLCDLFDQALPGYRRVEGAEPGWKEEGSIYYREELFQEIGHGYVDLHMPERKRGLFWVRLQDQDGRRFVCATVHFTHQLNADENRSGLPWRPAEARLAGKALNEIAKDEPVILAGDFNDPVQVVRILHEEYGLEDLFRKMGVPSPCTFPCLFLSDEDWQVEAIDKLMGRNIRPLVATSPHYHTTGHVLSDHWPVMTIFELE